MLTFTEAGDTPQRVAHRVLGHPDQSYADKIWQANSSSFARQLFNDSGIFAANRALWLPEYSRIDDDPNLRNDILHQLEFIPSNGRANLVKLQKCGVDVNRLVGAAKCIRQHNRVNFDQGKDIAASLGVQATVETIKRGAERAGRPAELFTKHMRNLNDIQRSLISTRSAGEHSAIQAERGVYRTAFKEAEDALGKGAKLYANGLSKKSAKYLMSAKHSEFMAHRKGIFVNDLDDVKMISKIAKYGRWAGRGCFAFSAALGVDEIYETNEHHGDVWGKAGEVVAEIGSALAIGAICLAIFTPVGWVAVVATAIVEGGLIAYGSHEAGKLGKIIGDDVHKDFDWAKKALPQWL